MSIHMDTAGMPVPPTRRASVRVKTAEVITHSGRYLADVTTRHVTPMHHARTMPTTEEPQAVMRAHSKRTRPRFLTIFGIGMFCIAAVCYGWTTWISPGMERSKKQHIYGESHAVILSARVGHHDEATPSLFLAFPRDGRLYLVELAGGDPERTHAYLLGMYAGREEDMTMTLVARDENADSKIDLIITVGGSQARWILYNTGERFEHNAPVVSKEEHEQQTGGQEE